MTHLISKEDVREVIKVYMMLNPKKFEGKLPAALAIEYDRLRTELEKINLDGPAPTVTVI